jgi:small-conductance mechanosensitive channel
LIFELVVWATLEAVKRPRAMNAAYTWAIDDALRHAGNEIPFPQRDIRVRSFFGAEVRGSAGRAAA